MEVNGSQMEKRGPTRANASRKPRSSSAHGSAIGLFFPAALYLLSTAAAAAVKIMAQPIIVKFAGRHFIETC